MNDIELTQMEHYRRMSGEERLRIGLGLFESSVNIAREAVRNQFPDADERTVEQKVQQRIHIGYEIQQQSQAR